MWQCSPTVCTGDASAPASPNTSGPSIRPWTLTSHTSTTQLGARTLRVARLVLFLCFILLFPSSPFLCSHSALTLTRIRLLAGPLSYPLPSCSLLGALLRQTGTDASRSPMTVHDITVSTLLAIHPSCPPSHTTAGTLLTSSLLYLQCNTFAVNILSLSFQPRSYPSIQPAHHCDMAAWMESWIANGCGHHSPPSPTVRQCAIVG